MGKIKWGILATGNIACQFAEALKYVKDAEIRAVASRDISRADKFALKYGIKQCYGDYRRLAENKELDIVYIGTPNSCHIQDAIMLMDNGKHVLCEKPLSANAKEAEAMIQKAKENDVFFMEGMWTRFFPAVRKGMEWIAQGRIGKPRSLYASLGLDVGSKKDAMWRFNTAMAGGGR